MGTGRGDSRRRSRSASHRRSSRRREVGTVNTWNVGKQFGFVSCTSCDRPDLFIHAEYFENLEQRQKAKTRGLRRGDKIEFEVEEPQAGKKSGQAVHATLIEAVRRSPSGSRSRSRGRGRDPPRQPRPNIEFRPGDWECQCGFHNFAKNTFCMKCSAPKDGPRRGGGRSDSRRRSSPPRGKSPPQKRPSSPRRRSGSRRSSPGAGGSRAPPRDRSPVRRSSPPRYSSPARRGGGSPPRRSPPRRRSSRSPSLRR